jgi:putative oxidoreductase
MDVIALIARILFASLFLASGLGHLVSTEALAGYAAVKKLPQPRLAVQASGVWLIIAALMLMFGVWPDLGALALVPFLLLSAFLFHSFWQESDVQVRTQEQTQFLKDLALAGGALGFFVLYGSVTNPGLNLVGPLFSMG